MCKFRLGRLQVACSNWGSSWKRVSGWRSLWGRFGGGWRWKLGIDIGGKTILFHLIWGSVSFSWVPPEKEGI